MMKRCSWCSKHHLLFLLLAIVLLAVTGGLSLEHPTAFAVRSPAKRRTIPTRIFSSSGSGTNSNMHHHPPPLQLVVQLRGGGADSSTLAAPPSQLYNASAVDAGSLSVEDLMEQLATDIDTGLTDEQVQERLAIYGPNTLDKAQKASIWKLIAEQFDDRLVQILVVVAMVSAIFSVLEHTADQSLLQSFVEPLVIVAILICNAAVGVWQSQSASDSLDALQELQPTYATVVRNSQVPADARLVELQSSTLQVDETSLTGESVTVSKLPGTEGQSAVGAPVQLQTGMVFSGTMITSGNGLAVVAQTGMATQFGKIQQGVTQAKESTQKTPLAIKLDDFGHDLTFIIGAICFAVWLVSIPKMNDSSFANVWEGAIYYAKVSVALGVAAIPEGLPAVITLCLSLGTRRMAQRNVIVRKLPSVETLGCTSVICTDKTGTLTTNEMTAVSLVLLESSKEGIVEHAIDGTSYSPIGTVEGVQEDEVARKGAVADVAAVAALCNDATIVGNDEDWIQVSDEGDEEDVDPFGANIRSRHDKADKKKNQSAAVVKKAYDRTGEPTEAALCVLCEKLGGMEESRLKQLRIPPSELASANVDVWREAHPRMATLEFHRERKSMSVLASFGNQKNRLLVKGAPNLLLERCTHIKDRNGKVVRITGPIRRQLENKISELATRPLRCLALAVKDGKNLEKSLEKFDGEDVSQHPLLKNSAKYRDIESGLTLVGIVGIKDPARPEVAESIRLCTKAGIRVMMITGDARDTAIAIAKDVQIFDKDTPNDALKAFEGREFFLKPEKEQLEILKEDNIVFCRAEPADKQKLVKMLQSLHEIPAMTGDGVNDAPALQQAAIGIAMGTGTEVSKEAADMILADDNFSTIVSAVEEGRTIYANMQAFICFLISCNIGEICAIFFATLAGFPEPLTAMHLLWVNLVTDGPPATALGFNPPAPDIMESPPRPSDEPIMTKWLLTRYVLTGLYVGLATIGIFVQHYLQQGLSLSELSNWSQCGTYWLPKNGGPEMCSVLFRESGRMLPQTLALTTLVSPLRNKWLLLGVSGPFLLHLAVVYSSKLGIPAMGEAFGMVPLSIEDWTNVALWATPILFVDEILKAIGRRLKTKDQGKIKTS
eukprot:scaffold13560_cov161-Cylindrotheca_fusiformis.AAC.10